MGNVFEVPVRLANRQLPVFVQVLMGSIDMKLTRRSVFHLGGAGAAVALVPAAARQAFAGEGPFTQDTLPYAFDALEPHIDAATMMLHHGKHHAGQVKGVNKAVADHSQLHGLSIQELMTKLGELPEDIRGKVRNAGGGHANHSMYWTIMGPGGGGTPTGELAAAIDRDFGSFGTFQEAFNDAGKGQFGSGWCWATVSSDGRIAVTSTPNQDNPYMEGKAVLMGNDVWEHAYYLNYKNRRGDYLAAWWNTLNWSAINDRYDKISGGALI